MLAAGGAKDGDSGHGSEKQGCGGEMVEVSAAIAPIGFILAGGKSSRFGGQEKCSCNLSGRPLLGHVLDRLSPQVGEVVLNANGDPGRFGDFGLTVISDAPGAGLGPLGGLLACLEWAAAHRPGRRAIVTVPCDTPFLPGDLVARLVAAAEIEASRPACATGRDGLHPVIGVWPVALASALRRFLFDEHGRKTAEWARRCGAEPVSFPGPDDGLPAVNPLFNINTPEDLHAAEALISGKARPAAPSG